MKIDADVAAIAKRWSNSQVFARLIQAVVTAEGNIIKAVQISIPSVTTREEAIEITCRSATHAMADYLFDHSTEAEGFVHFWANRWAPQGVDNDPTNLNRNWPVNVLKLWRKP